jgi:hypothetical protein
LPLQIAIVRRKKEEKSLRGSRFLDNFEKYVLCVARVIG